MEPFQIPPYLDLIIRLVLNISIAWIIAMGLFYHYSKKKSFVFCLFMFNTLIFIVGYILSNVELGMGTGLGLFALFTMLRYRSETLNLREMTYLFIIITVGFINSTRQIDNLGSVTLLDFVIILSIYLLEKYVGSRILSTEKLKYDNLELLKPQYRHLLHQDIFMKTGIKVKSIDIDSISLADKTASLTVYYDESEYLNVMEQKSGNPELLPENRERDQEKIDKKNKKQDEEVVLRVLH